MIIASDSQVVKRIKDRIIQILPDSGEAISEGKNSQVSDFPLKLYIAGKKNCMVVR
jgi:hypothetical protein